MIIQDYTGAHEQSCTAVHFDEVKEWQEKVALFISGSSPTSESY